MKNNNESIIIKNERILSFFKTNQQLNIETVLMVPIYQY